MHSIFEILYLKFNTNFCFFKKFCKTSYFFCTKYSIKHIKYMHECIMFLAVKNFHSRNQTLNSPIRHSLFQTRIYTLPFHCSRDPWILYFVLNWNYFEKVESGFVSDTDCQKTVCLDEGWLFVRHWNRLLFSFIFSWLDSLVFLFPSAFSSHVLVFFFFLFLFFLFFNLVLLLVKLFPLLWNHYWGYLFWYFSFYWFGFLFRLE